MTTAYADACCVMYALREPQRELVCCLVGAGVDPPFVRSYVSSVPWSCLGGGFGVVSEQIRQVVCTGEIFYAAPHDNKIPMLAVASFPLAFSAPGLAPAAHQRAAVSMASFSWSQPGEGQTWDPLNLAKTPEKFERLRYVEVKHGRIAMLAVLGHLTAGSGARFPGELSNSLQFSDVEGTGFKALSQLGPADYAIILMSVAFLEIRVMKEVVKGEFPGDLRNGAWRNSDERHIPATPLRTAAVAVTGLDASD